MKSYRTIAHHACAEHEIKKSRFIGEVFRVHNEDEAIRLINEVKERHKTARHHVYAYILNEGQRSRYTDDGEPALTAGIPALTVLQQHDLKDVLTVVTRYFGGTLLGTGGLVRAYTRAVNDALNLARIVTITWACKVDIVVTYPLYERTLAVLRAQNAQILDTHFTDCVTITCALAHEQSKEMSASLIQATNGQARITRHNPCFMELDIIS